MGLAQIEQNFIFLTQKIIKKKLSLKLGFFFFFFFGDQIEPKWTGLTKLDWMDRIVLNGQEWIEWTEVTQYGPKFYFDVAQNEHGNNKLYTLTLYRYKLEP